MPRTTYDTRTPNRKASKKRFTSTTHGKAIIIIASLMGFLVLCAAGLAFFFLSKINYTPLDKFGYASSVPTDEIDPSDPSVPSENPGDMQYATGGILSDKQIQNILVIGSDTRGGSGYGRSDSMILVSIDKKNNRIVMTSFLRDLYVKIGVIKDNRINTAYGYGGPKLLIETIQNNFRIKVDNYVRIDFESFKSIINAIGGISIQLTASEAYEINNNASEIGLQHVNAGVNSVNGATALAYSRIRHIDSDFGRTQRQRNVIKAVIAKLKSSSPSTILGIANQFLPQIQTDLTSTQITGLIMESGTLMNYPMSQQSIPVAGAYRDVSIRGMRVLLPDIEKNKAAIWSLIYNK